MLIVQLAGWPPFSFILRFYALFPSLLPVFIKLTVFMLSGYLLSCQIWLKPNNRLENYFKAREQKVGGRYMI